MYNHILVPISFDQDRDQDGAKAVAQRLSEEGGIITFIHIIEEIPVHAAAYLPAEYLDVRKGQVHADVIAVAKDVPNARTAVVPGHAGRTIVDYAKDNGVDCIVIASHRPGMQDLLLGSTAAKVVRHAPCAVHVLR